MTDPKSTKPATRKTTRSRSGAKSGAEGGNAAGAFDQSSAETAAPQSNEPRTGEEPVLAIQQVSDADTADRFTSNESDQSYSAEGANGSAGLDGEIRRRAYEIYLARGGADGNDLEDWLEAERSVHSPRRGTGRSVHDLPATE
jgi:hypothetical protein